VAEAIDNKCLACVLQTSSDIWLSNLDHESEQECSICTAKMTLYDWVRELSCQEYHVVHKFCVTIDALSSSLCSFCRDFLFPTSSIEAMNVDNSDTSQNHRQELQRVHEERSYLLSKLFYVYSNLWNLFQPELS
jgi:hypothetical protein